MSRSLLHDWECAIDKCCRENNLTGMIDIAEDIYNTAYVRGKNNSIDGKEVLDKIRAEIEQAADKQLQIAMGVSDLNERYAHIQMDNAYRHSLNIIDKYKAESEDKECHIV